MGTVSGRGHWNARGVHEHVWPNLTTSASVGTWLDAPMLPDKTVMLLGTLGTGGAVQIEGSHATGATGQILNDPSDNALTLSTLKSENIRENPAKIRPRLSAGGALTDLTVYITSQSHRR